MGNNPSFKEIPNGMPGLHWRLPIILNEVLKKQCNLDLNDFVRITSTMPAKIYGLYPKKGEIKIGSDADITIWNKDKKVILTDDMVVDGSKYNPYSGFEVSCWPDEVLLRGHTIVKNNKIMGKQNIGKFLPTKLSDYI